VLIAAATLDAAITESVERPEHEGPTVGHIGLAVALPGKYPPDEQTLDRFRAWAKESPS
jgi:hypothetical protein